MVSTFPSLNLEPQSFLNLFNVLLALVNLDVPLAPDLGGSEHAAGTAHVTEGGLTGTVSTTTGDTGDTGNSAT